MSPCCPANCASELPGVEIVIIQRQGLPIRLLCLLESAQEAQDIAVADEERIVLWATGQLALVTLDGLQRMHGTPSAS